jgi:hypothetical protein
MRDYFRPPSPPLRCFYASDQAREITSRARFANVFYRFYVAGYHYSMISREAGRDLAGFRYSRKNAAKRPNSMQGRCGRARLMG